jgi:hypothetical protein
MENLMTRHAIWPALVGLILILGTTTSRADTPKEAVGFWGTVSGKVKAARPDGMSFVLTISDAQPDDSKSKVKDGAPMVGKDITLGTRMPRKNGVPYPSEEDVAYIKTLKPGMMITVKIFAVISNPRVLRIQEPGKAAG